MGDHSRHDESFGVEGPKLVPSVKTVQALCGVSCCPAFVHHHQSYFPVMIVIFVTWIMIPTRRRPISTIVSFMSPLYLFHDALIQPCVHSLCPFPSFSSLSALSSVVKHRQSCAIGAYRVIISYRICALLQVGILTLCSCFRRRRRGCSRHIRPGLSILTLFLFPSCRSSGCSVNLALRGNFASFSIG